MPEVAGDALENPLALRPGVLLDGRYRVVRVLSTTSPYAVVYAAYDEREQTLVAVKELLPRSLAARAPLGLALRPHSPADEAELAKAVKRFLREHDLLADVRHPALVRVHRTFAENGTAYVVMDHVEVVPLERHARLLSGRMTIQQAVDFMTPVLELLETVHADGMLHRDLSPATVHVDGSGRAILLSFPSRRFVQGGREHATGFAAIELYGSRSIGPWTDVYACAALLYFLATGVAPISAVDRASGQHLASPNALVPVLSPAFSNVITRGMGQLPEQRPHGTGELQRQLTTALTASTFAPPAPALGDQPVPDGATRAQQLTAMDIQAILTDETPRLKLSAGVLVPEDHGLIARMRRWLHARSQQREAGAVAAAAASALARTPEPVADATPLSVPPPAPAPDDAPMLVAPLAAPVPEAAPPAAARVDESLVSIQQQDEPLAQWLESIRREARELEAAQREAREREVSGTSSEPEMVEPTVREAAAREPEPPALADAEVGETTGALVEFPGSETELPLADPAPALLVTEETRRIPDMAPFARRRSSRAAVAVSSLALLGIVAVSVANSSRLKQPAAPPPAFATGDRATVGGTSTKQVGGPIMLPPAAVQGDSIRVTEAGGTVLQGVSSGKTAARTTPERQREVPVAVGPTDAGAREALAAIQSSVIVGQTAPLRVVPPELLIDLRDRFAAGRQLADNGNYGAARQAFRAALVQIDSISSRYITSEGLRSLRNDIEQESARVLAACNAENEMHRRRGGKVQSCA